MRRKPRRSPALSTWTSAVPCATSRAPGPISSRVDVLVRMVPAAIGGVDLSGPGRPIGSRACLGCHSDSLSGGVLVKNGLRIDHGRCAADGHCGDCHSPASHGSSTRVVRAPSMSECVACHTQSAASVGCVTCHEGQLPSDRVRDPEWVRVHGPDGETLHGQGDLGTCSVCHEPSDCRRCHDVDLPHPAGFGATHGAAAIDSGRDACLTCHKRPEFCDSCHGTEMPHPDDYLQQHSTIASSEQDPSCAPCHVVADCQNCHEFHVHPGGTAPPVGRTGRK